MEFCKSYPAGLHVRVRARPYSASCASNYRQQCRRNRACATTTARRRRRSGPMKRAREAAVAGGMGAPRADDCGARAWRSTASSCSTATATAQDKVGVGGGRMDIPVLWCKSRLVQVVFIDNYSTFYLFSWDYFATFH